MAVEDVETKPEEEASEKEPAEPPAKEEKNENLEWFLLTNPFTRKQTKYLVGALMFGLVILICVPLITTGISEHKEALDAHEHAKEQWKTCQDLNLTVLLGLNCTDWQSMIDEEETRAGDAMSRAVAGAGGLVISILAASGLMLLHARTRTFVRRRRMLVRSLVDRLSKKNLEPVAELAQWMRLKVEVVEVLLADLNKAKIVRTEIRDAVVVPFPDEKPVEKEKSD